MELNDEAFQSLFHIVWEYQEVLARKRRQLVYRDDYGVEKTDRWTREIRYFVDSVIVPRAELETAFKDWDDGSDALYYLMPHGDGVAQFSLPTIERMIEGVATDHGEIARAESGAEHLDGKGFELYCFAELEKLGWEVTLTNPSADQGVDIVATRGASRVAIQCKKYSSPVGNAAVQEVHAGRMFYDARHAVVVSNADYTSAARQLAASTGTHLLHYAQLHSLAALVGAE